MIDDAVSAKSPAGKISNIMAANIGVSFKATDKLKLTADLWIANLAEEVSDVADARYGEDSLGTEVNLKAAYQLMEGLNLDVVAAMLFAGDATYKGTDQEDPFQLAARLSLSF
jgi:hypothetical protein